MARKNGEMPKVSIHKTSKNARVRINRKTHWLGRCPDGKVTQDQLTRAACLWQQYLSYDHAAEEAPSTQDVTSTDEETSSGITLASLGLRYLDYAEVYYQTPDGKTTSSVDGIRMALRTLLPFADMPAAAFGPKMLKNVQEMLVHDGRPRVGVNRVVKTVRQLFKWAASEELVSAEVWHSLQTVSPLQKGRTHAPERPRVTEVDEMAVEATLPHLSRVVATMVQVQRLMGARPGEVCLMRPADIDRSGDIWIYTPEHHKLSWRDDNHMRRLAIGPECQKLITPFLLRSPNTYCFSPCQTVRELNDKRREARTTKLWPSHANRKKKGQGGRAPRERYDTDSYRRAITRACKQAGVEPWSPNQLRHLRACEIKEKLGIEVAGAVLGHRHLKTTEVYADRRLKQAVEAARDFG